MAAQAVQYVTKGGTTPVFTPANAGGDTFKNSGSEILHVKNAGATPETVTINSVSQCNFGFDHDLSITIAAGGEAMIGSFETRRFNDQNGNVEISYTAVTSLTLAVYRIR